MIQNLFDLTGKVALITGGNGGIGLGMAEGLASQGCEVAIWGTNAEKNEQAKQLALSANVGQLQKRHLWVSVYHE